MAGRPEIERGELLTEAVRACTARIEPAPPELEQAIREVALAVATVAPDLSADLLASIEGLNRN